MYCTGEAIKVPLLLFELEYSRQKKRAGLKKTAVDGRQLQSRLQEQSWAIMLGVTVAAGMF